ncbi:hypothetical protein GHT06_011397 [Daphnia sinensis]|uniref:Helicase c-terminal domain containing protein n=1 Tax=Daphnia sinensis TaxID=1820382 RepID=A0AAD5KZX7_9CRUS|nr:hypothetical protein GHT06_011397 [Daphnia sinensis]
MWEKKISPLLTNSITPKQHKKLQNDVICMLLEIETNNDEEFCNELLTNAPDLKTAVALLRRALYPGASYSQDNVEKNVEHLIAAMRKDESKLPSSAMSLGYSWLLDDVQDVVEKSKIKSNQEANKLEYKLKEKKIQKLIKEWQTDGLKLNHTSIVDFVFVYDYAVQKKCTKKGDEQTFRLRDTQRVTIVTLLLSEGKNVLTQVSTGEGKSLIVAGVAIAFALCRNKENKKKKIDVITSNDVLARRDSTLTVADCGLRDLYEYFNVSVANNCSQWVDERTQAYNAIVVYGQLANFQRDYLLDNFYDHNIRGDRTMDLAIIDEVDCMLLDRGSNTLYLSHDIPGMEMLESLYVFIWGKIRSSSNGSNHIEIIKSIKSAILHDLYGAITKDDLESIHSPLKDKPSEKNALWDHLVETKVIDLQGRLLMEDTIESINFNPQINPKVKFYLSSVAKRERSIRIPEHLMPFVDLHLDTWLNNAMQALELKRDEDYVVDQDRTDTNPNLNPQVIIIDRDTGMDQTSSQWDGALHQFVQLKEGCKLTSQCLKAIFVSNAKYVQSYEKTVGVSGTLGSGPERDFLLRNYSSIPVEIPTAFQKRFYLRPTRIFSSEEHWLHAIVKEARQIIVPEDRAKARSLVIFCQSINNVNIIYRYLKNAFKGQIKANHIHCYTRDYEKFAFEGKPLGVGHVIIATNLAGRGTDIKISDQLRENGGLHICLTFLSKNERIEEQAIGRTARNGAPGSGIFLLWETSPMVKKWGAGKWLSMKEERQWREKQRISRLQEDFGDTEFEKSLFDKLSDYYSKLKRKLKEEKREHQEIKTICDSVLDKWALWLDQREDHISYMAGYQLELPDCSTTDISWMTPVRSVTMAKHLSLQKSSLSEAGEILKRIIDSKDSELYPAAHYYFAFVLIQEGFQENKTKFIQILQKCETILSNDIEKHLSFYRKVALATPDQAPSFCVIDAYKQQKDNIVKILEYFIGSVRALLGSHYCSVSNLIEAGKEEKKEKNFLKKAETFLQNKRLEFARFQKERKSKCKSEQTPKICPEQADKLFELMVEKKCITCRLNDTDTIPNRDAIIQQVANEHRIEKLMEKLKIVFGRNLTEEQIEKNLKKENLIPCTRKAFWEELRNKGVLQAVKGGLCSKMKCVIVLESECDVEPNKLNSKKLNRENRIKIEDFQFGLDSFDQENNCLNVLYNPIYDNMSDLLKQKKIMFSKEYVKEQLGEKEYRCRKEKFELNKIAQLNLKKLEEIVKLKGSCSLGKNDLMRANIISDSEQGSVLNKLIEKHVIDANGELSSNYQKFSYPDCPAYEEPVMRVIGRIFVAEIVKRQWLRAAQDANCLKAINLLPLKPYRDLLGDLMAAHVISGARVTEDAKLIEKETQEIEDEDERECVRKFLKSRQAVYASRMKKSEIFLDLIERDIRKIPNTVNISTELYTFDLAAFNHVIDIKDAKSSWKTYLGATFAGAVGIASIGVGIFLIHGKMLSFGFSKNLLLMGGASDILYAITTILTHSKFTWADYTRQRLRSAMGKTEPIEMIKTIYKLCDSSENADFRKTINLAIGLERWKRQHGGQINKIHETLLGRSVKQVGLINHQTEFHFHMQLHYLFQDFSSFILRKTKKCVTKNFTEIRKALTQFNELHGLKTSQDFVREKLNQLISHWAAEGQKWVCAIIDETTLKLNEIAGTGGVPLTQEIADKGIRLMESIFNYYEVRMKLVRVTVTCIREFLLGLENHANPEDPIAKNIDVEEFKLFQKKMMADIDSELERQVAKILGILRQRIHQVTSDQISSLANVNSEMYTTLLH